MSDTESTIEALREQLDDLAASVELPSDLIAHATVGGRRRRTRGKVAATAAVVAVVTSAVAIIGLVSVGSARPQRLSVISTAPKPPRSTPPKAADDSTLVTEMLDDYLPATGPEFTEGQQFEGTVLALREKVTNSCMAQAGFAATPIQPASEIGAQIYDASQFPDLTTIAQTGMFGPVVTAKAAGAGFPHAARAAYRSQLKQCSLTAAAQISDPIRQAWQSLSTPWWTTVMHVQASAPVQRALAGFTSCAVAAGVPARDADTLGDFASWSGGPAGPNTTTAAITASEHHWTPVFLRCANATVTLQERQQSAQRAAFIQTHTDQIKQAETTTLNELSNDRAQYTTGSRSS